VRGVLGKWLVSRTHTQAYRVCTDRRPDELAVLHSHFEERAARKQSDSRVFSNLIEDTMKGARR
jgi:hypothetical protein